MENVGIDDDQEAGAPEAGAGPSADASLLLTPENIVDIEAEIEKLEELFKEELLQVLEDIPKGRITQNTHRLVVLNAPACCVQSGKDYPGGAFDPERRGAACIVAGEVDGVTKVNNSDAKWGLNPMGLVNSSATSQPFLRKVPCSFRARGKHSAPDINFTAYKYYLEEPDFLAPSVDDFFALEDHPSAADFLALDAQPSSAEPSSADPPEASEPAPEATDPPGASEANAHAPLAAPKPAGTKKKLPVYLIANMCARRAKKARVSLLPPTITTAVDNAPSTPADAAASETTPDEDSSEVTGLVERLNLTGAASTSDAAAGSGEAGTVVERAAALKTQGNAHFVAGAYHPALALYSEAIEMLEGAGEDAVLATLLCNRSVAYLKFTRPGAALVDAERAGALGAGKAHFRLAEALSKLGLYDEALEAYGAALGNAQEGGDTRAVRDKIEALTHGRVEVRATPADFAQKLLRAAPGSTLLLARGRYTGPFEIRVGVSIVWEGAPGGVVLDSTEGSATLAVLCAGRVVLQGLDVRRTAGEVDTSALVVLSGQVTTDKCTFSSKVGACVGVANQTSRVVLRGGAVSQGIGTGVVVRKGAGVIVGSSARVHAIKVTVSENKCAGIEVRESGELDLDNCELRKNQQGLLLYCEGKSARVNRCRVHSHDYESAVLCQTGELTMAGCLVEGNLIGITIAGGWAVVKGCEVRKQKMHGILVQQSGSALVEENNIHHNNVHGVFVGYDVHYRVTVRNNDIHHNSPKGIENGVPKSKKVLIEGNTEWENGLPKDPGAPGSARSTFQTMQQLQPGGAFSKAREGGMTKEAKEKQAHKTEVDMRRWKEDVRKTGGSEDLRNVHEQIRKDKTLDPQFKTWFATTDSSQGLECLECGTPSQEGTQPLLCSKCRVAVYCSRACQKAHWKGGHKGTCQKLVEFQRSGDGEDVRHAHSGASDPGFERKLTIIEAGISQGDPAMMMEKAYILAEAKDFAPAKELFEEAAALGYVPGMVNLGQCYMHGNGTPKDHAKAQKILSEASEKGSAEAMALLGNLFSLKDGAKAATTAQDWWQRALRKDPSVEKHINRLPEDFKPEDARRMASNPIEFLREFVKQSPREDAGPKEDLLKAFESAFGNMLGEGGARAQKPLGQAQGVEGKLKRAQVIDQYARREGFVECKAYSLAFNHGIAFWQLKEQGDLGEKAFSHLYEALFINERAVMLDDQDHAWGRSFAQQLLCTPSTSAKMRCQALFVQGHFTKEPIACLPLFAKLFQESPPSARVCELLAASHGFLRQWGELERLSLRSLEIDAGYYHAYYALAVAAKQISDNPKAIQHFKKYLQECPKDANKSVDAMFGISLCILTEGNQSGKDNRAKKGSNRPSKKDPWEGKDLAEAKKYYTLGVERDEELARFWGISDQGDRKIVELYLKLAEPSRG